MYTFISSIVMSSGLALLLLTIAPAQAQQDDSLNIAITLEPPVLDPSINDLSSVQKVTYQNIFEGLTQIDSLNQVKPSLATDWEVDETELIYTFKLRENVFFHDNRPLTGTIVKASLERVAASNSTKYKLNEIDQVTVISKHLIRIRLSWSDGHFLYKLGLANAVIQHPRSWATNHIKPIGTGPYRFVDWKKGENIQLVANAYYWGDIASIKNITVFFSKTRAQIVDDFMTKGIDAYSGMTDISFLGSLLATRREYILSQGNSSGEIILAMNHANKMLSSLDIRRGITMAINKKEIADTQEFMAGDIIGSHYSPSDSAYLDLSNAYPFNIAEAKLLIEKANVPIRSLVLLSPPSAYAEYIGAHIKTMLQKIGLWVTIEEVSWEEWLTRVYENKDYDLTLIVHTEPFDLDFYARDDYYFNYKSDDYKKIIEQLSHNIDKTQREALLKEAQQKLSDDAVNVFLFMMPNVGVWHKRLQGYWLNEPVPAMIFAQMSWQ